MREECAGLTIKKKILVKFWGVEKIVEIDENLFIKRKTNAGYILP